MQQARDAVCPPTVTELLAGEGDTSTRETERIEWGAAN